MNNRFKDYTKIGQKREAWRVEAEEAVKAGRVTAKAGESRIGEVKTEYLLDGEPLKENERGRIIITTYALWLSGKRW